jgi:hypothetical protein
MRRWRRVTDSDTSIAYRHQLPSHRPILPNSSPYPNTTNLSSPSPLRSSHDILFSLTHHDTCTFDHRLIQSLTSGSLSRSRHLSGHNNSLHACCLLPPYFAQLNLRSTCDYTPLNPFSHNNTRAMSLWLEIIPTEYLPATLCPPPESFVPSKFDRKQQSAARPRVLFGYQLDIKPIAV